MMLRADLISTKRILITLLLALITLVYALPRLLVMTITSDYSYESFVGEWLYVYDLESVERLMMTAMTIYFAVYINRRIVHSQPTLFSTLPAKLWEKLISIVLYSFVLSLLYIVAARVEFLLEYCTVPGMPWSEYFTTLDIIPLYIKHKPSLMINGINFYRTADSSLYSWLCAELFLWGLCAYGYACLFTAMIYIRNSFIGLLTSSIVSIVLFIILVFITMHIFRENHPIREAQLLLHALYVWVLAGLGAYLSYRKLRKVAS